MRKIIFYLLGLLIFFPLILVAGLDVLGYFDVTLPKFINTSILYIILRFFLLLLIPVRFLVYLFVDFFFKLDIEGTTRGLIYGVLSLIYISLLFGLYQKVVKNYLNK
jgi:hypothetical protein